MEQYLHIFIFVIHIELAKMDSIIAFNTSLWTETTGRKYGFYPSVIDIWPEVWLDTTENRRISSKKYEGVQSKILDSRIVCINES